MKTRIMCNSSALLKKEFLKNWIKGLHIYTNFKKEMTLLERKKAIKLSADVAMASTRNGSTHWSRAVLADSPSAEADTRNLGSQKKSSENLKMNKCRMGKKILRRRCMAGRRRVRARGVVHSSSIAKKLIEKRTRVLKRLVPGGEEMDEVSLIKETLDYVVSLRVQVDVMRRIAERLESTMETNM